MRIITGIYKGRHFDVPRTFKARPTTDFAKENIFNVLGGYLDFDGITALDLFAGTGAVSFELLSRGCPQVTCVEIAATQLRFIHKVKDSLQDPNLNIIRADVFKFIGLSHSAFDLIFADPPYEHPRFAEIPELILGSQLVRPGTLVIIEHSKAHDFSNMPQFSEHRNYGKVNFSFFNA